MINQYQPDQAVPFGSLNSKERLLAVELLPDLAQRRAEVVEAAASLTFRGITFIKPDLFAPPAAQEAAQRFVSSIANVEPVDLNALTGISPTDERHIEADVAQDFAPDEQAVRFSPDMTTGTVEAMQIMADDARAQLDEIPDDSSLMSAGEI